MLLPEEGHAGSHPASSIWLSVAKLVAVLPLPSSALQIEGPVPGLLPFLPHQASVSLAQVPGCAPRSQTGPFHMVFCVSRPTLSPQDTGMLWIGDPVCIWKEGSRGESASLPIGFIQCSPCPTGRVPLLLRSAEQRWRHRRGGQPGLLGGEQRREGQKRANRSVQGVSLVWSGSVQVWRGQRLGAEKSHSW